MTPEEHNKYISWTFLANGLFQGTLLLLMFGFIVAMLSGTQPPDDGFPIVFFSIFFGVMLVINLAMIAPNFVAYYALKNRRPWARIATIIAAVLSGMNVPIGTAACVYSLWFFFGEDWKSIYPHATGAAPDQLTNGGPEKWEGRYVRQDGEVVYRPAQPPDWH
jgi:hypothetical protein